MTRPGPKTNPMSSRSVINSFLSSAFFKTKPSLPRTCALPLKMLLYSTLLQWHNCHCNEKLGRMFRQTSSFVGLGGLHITDCTALQMVQSSLQNLMSVPKQCARTRHCLPFTRGVDSEDHPMHMDTPSSPYTRCDASDLADARSTWLWTGSPPGFCKLHRSTVLDPTLSWTLYRLMPG